MTIRFVGIDPNTGKDESPTVWVDDEARELVIQGWKAGPALTAEISGTAWAPNHSAGIPDSEVLNRIPLRMAGIIRKALDDAEAAGLLDDAEAGPQVSDPSGDEG
ncbi:hypothetical protein [Kitasatospora aureofaciens]|uniref:hypothetical protein n=1 Tax=Kitasatospora aureofaciens TaxID=1894 RepID=UPI001C491F75|nr:hypothetical protein [Kitasatospora aureofaciens]MBV6699359.1 hypothetical protein [Kitasatospora aureofaciens]